MLDASGHDFETWEANVFASGVDWRNPAFQLPQTPQWNRPRPAFVS
jgi:hypothetical protein